MTGGLESRYLAGRGVPQRRYHGVEMRRSDIEELEYLLDQEPREAVALAKKLVAETPADADAWGWLADAHVEAGDYEAALKALAEYLRRDPDWMEAYTLRSGLLTEMGRFDAAGVELEVARQIDATDTRLLRAEGFWHELQGRLEQADELYAKASGVDGLLPPPRFDRDKAATAIRAVLKQVAKEGLKLQAVIEEMPKEGSKDRKLSRQLELRDAGTLVVYLRNLERELTTDAEIDDLAELFEDRLAELVEAN